MQCLCLVGVIREDADLMVKIRRRVRLMRAYYKRSVRSYTYHMQIARLSLNTGLLKTEVIETLLYGCVTWTLIATQYDELREVHLEVLPRILGFQRHAENTNLSYAKALRRRHARASKRPSGNGGSFSLGQWYGETRGDYPVG